jgi:hypothetical protein
MRIWQDSRKANEKAIMISDDLSALLFDCDAPPYCVVRHCQEVGFDSPLDVRWRRLSQAQPATAGWRHWLGLWKRYLGRTGSAGLTCVCGTTLPEMRRFRYLDVAGMATDYLFGQCAHCRTMLWNQLR